MLGRSGVFLFRMKLGEMYVDYKLLSRDHRKSVRVEEALVDPLLPTTIVPLRWLEVLRSPSCRLPTGYYVEEEVYSAPNYGDRIRAEDPKAAGPLSASPAGMGEGPSSFPPNAIRAGPVVMYLSGQTLPVVLNPLFVDETTWGGEEGRGLWPRASGPSNTNNHPAEPDLRVGLDAIEQCGLFAELRPGGLLYSKLPHRSLTEALAGPREVLGIRCEMAASPLVPRPWTRMKYMFIDELQRGPELTEFVGHNPRSGVPWRFSQHTKHFRQGIWHEIVRRHQMNDGLHVHSSWQKSPQQSVPGIRFLAPFP
ncbi:unnamed protein product [Phytomonas sp. Hart1]|nr:unnamed protein product [Phytomonas sp. Hart1]|eukprot:CCW69427.1 unnamed protein product [Phytomonas sp. isolate Hart1]